MCFFFFQAEDGIRDLTVTGVQTCALPISIYEPGSFTPLVRLSTTASGDPQNEPHLLVQAIAAGLPDQDDPNHTPALAMMQTMLSAMPRDMQQDAARHLRQIGRAHV